MHTCIRRIHEVSLSKIVLFGLWFLICLFKPVTGYTQTKAISFSKSGDYLEVPHHNELAPSIFTIEFWLRVDELGDPQQAGGEQTIIDKRGTSSGYNIRLAGNEFPLPLFAFCQDGALGTDALIKQNIWHHVAVVQSDLRLNIFIDGQEAGDIANANYTGNTTAPLRIGEFLGHPGAYLGLRGAIDELRIWDKVRTVQEIQANMHQKMTGNESKLDAYWDFDKKNGNFILNKTKNTHHAQIHGMASLTESTAPIGFIPPEPQKGLRAFGEKDYIELVWDMDSTIRTTHIYRDVNSNFLPDATHLLTSVSAPKSMYQDNSVVGNQDYYYYVIREDISGHSSQKSTTLVSRWRGSFEDYQVGVYYYPWYGPQENGHNWKGQYTRDLLDNPQPPILSHYSSRDTAVIERHLDWMTAYGVDFLVSSWWGRNSWEDITLKDKMLSELEETTIQFSVYYESAMLGFSAGGIDFNQANEDRVVLDFLHLAERYFNHPNYLKVDGRPVVFLYLSGIYYGSYKTTFTRIRQELSAKGFDIYLIGDEVGLETPDLNHADFLDAVSPYILLGHPRHMDYPIHNDYFADLSMSMSAWEKTLHPKNLAIIPNVNPGFNNHKVSASGLATPRQMGLTYDHQSKLKNMIKVARPFVDSELRMLMITSWNEWHEDTQLEPVNLGPATNIDRSASGNQFTKDFYYEGYGFKPLEVVRQLLSDQSCQLSSTLFKQHVSCFGETDGVAQLKVRGAVEPVSYSWSTQDKVQKVEGLSAKGYTVTVVDGAGCVDMHTFVIDQPSELDIILDSVIHKIGDQAGGIYVSVEGGAEPYSYLWKLGEKHISITQDLAEAQAGVYSIQVTDLNGCIILKDSIVVDQLTDFQVQYEDEIKIYPNPNSGILYLTTNANLSQDFEICIFDAQGKPCKIFSTWQDKYSISDLAPGWYFCRIRSGLQSCVLKFVKGR